MYCIVGFLGILKFLQMPDFQFFMNGIVYFYSINFTNLSISMKFTEFKYLEKTNYTVCDHMCIPFTQKFSREVKFVDFTKWENLFRLLFHEI